MNKLTLPTMNKTTVTKILGLLALTAGLSLIPKPASAQVAVLCASCELNLPLINTSTNSLNAAFIKYQLYMTTGVGGTGLVSMGGGVIEQLQSLNDTLAELNTQTVDGVASANKLNQMRDYIKANNDINKQHMPTDVQRSCVDATMAGGFAGPSGGGGGSGGPGSPGGPTGTPATPPGPKATAAAQREVVRDRNYSDIANKGSKMLAHRGDPTTGFPNTCTQKEVDFGKQGCKTLGTYPGADTEAGNLTKGVQLPGSKTPSLPVLDPTQTKVAMAVINQTIPVVPSGTAKGANDSPQANEYNVDATVAKSRISFADDAMTDAIAMYSGKSDLSKTYNEIWKAAANSEDFKRVYGANAVAPKDPSQYMIYDFEIMRKLTDPKIMGAEQTKTPQAIAADQYRTQLVQAKIQLEQLAETQKNNRLLAVLIAQSFDPLTASSLKARLATLSNTTGK